MSCEFSEDKSVQETTACFLADTLGWETVYAHNNEMPGSDGILGRTSDKEVVLKHYLEAAVRKYNPGLPDIAYAIAVNNITEISYTRALILQNKEKYTLFSEGVPVSYMDEQSRIKQVRIKIFDFGTPENNHFLAVRELRIQGPLYRRQADIVCFVNGIPLLFMELKATHKCVRDAFDVNMKDYFDTIPHVFCYNALIIIGNRDAARVGTLSGTYEHFMNWKRLKEEEVGSLDFEIMLRGICAKSAFMDIFENFILFNDTQESCIKILARNHQYLGVNRALEAFVKRKPPDGKWGVFRHTQGSGKSYAMVFLCKKIRRKITGNFTFLVVTGREDLERQIHQTFTDTGLVTEKGCRAATGEALNALLKSGYPIVFTMIHNFNREVFPDNLYNNGSQKEIIVLSDENYGSQYGTLALNMRSALPHAAFIEFTGTPLLMDDDITRHVFGEDVSTYDFKRAVDDGIIAPLYYESRGEKLGLSTENINEKIAAALGNVSPDREQQVLPEKEFPAEYHIFTAEKRLAAIAGDFADHYTERWETGKAMILCIDRITTIRMYNLVQEAWKRKINEIAWQVNREPDSQEVLVLHRKIRWMQETRMAVIINEAQGEEKKYGEWDRDSELHSQLIKNCFETADGSRIDLETAFKNEAHPFRVAFISAMWLTGFDVKCLATLYLDKPLNAHTLIQAMARVNRLHTGKENGLVVDYCGILNNLRKIPAVYYSGSETALVRPEAELLTLLEQAIKEVKTFLGENGFQLETVFTTAGFEKIKAIRNAKETVNRNDEIRKRFEVRAREVFNKFKAALYLKAGINRYRREYSAINIIYRKIQEDRETGDISSIIKKLHKVTVKNIEPEKTHTAGTKFFDMNKINFDLLMEEFRKYPLKNTIVQELMAAIRRKLQQMIRHNPLRLNFQERYAAIIAEYNNEKNCRTIEETFGKLLAFVKELDGEEKRPMCEKLDEEKGALFDLLQKPGLSGKAIKTLKKTTRNLLKALKTEKLKNGCWREKEATRDVVKVFIKEFLCSEKNSLPVSAYNEAEIFAIADKVYEHVFRQYESAEKNVYRIT